MPRSDVPYIPNSSPPVLHKWLKAVVTQLHVLAGHSQLVHAVKSHSVVISCLTINCAQLHSLNSLPKIPWIATPSISVMMLTNSDETSRKSLACMAPKQGKPAKAAGVPASQFITQNGIIKCMTRVWFVPTLALGCESSINT